jgi:3-oxoadipate CoA-transferase beta subunit
MSLETLKLSNAQIAWRAAQDIEDGAYVNLGIGFPEMVAKFQPPAARRFSTPKTACWALARRPSPDKRTGT